jgi:hypothetical protein
MHRLLMLVLLLAPVAPTVRGEDVPAEQELRQLQARDVPAKEAIGDLYFVAIGQQSDWKFLPEGFATVVRDQGKTLYR